MSENQFERSNMADVAECSELIKSVVPRDHRSIKDWINATARKLGWEYGRTRDIWYANARRIDGFEKEKLKSIRLKAQVDEEQRIARHEYNELCDRITRLEAALSLADEDHGRPFIDALREVLGGMGVPGNRGE